MASLPSRCPFPLFFDGKDCATELFQTALLFLSMAGAQAAPGAGQDSQIGERPNRRRAVPGKGHRKSKKGCINCKTRRVKCSEELPTCRACRRLGLECQYMRPPPPPPFVPSGPLRIAPAALALEDLRFFHHFLTWAHPPLPFGKGRVWQDVAAMSHEVSSRP